MTDRNIVRNKILQRFEFKWNKRMMYIYLCAFNDALENPFGDIRGLMREMANNDNLIDEFMGYSAII